MRIHNEKSTMISEVCDECHKKYELTIELKNGVRFILCKDCYKELIRLLGVIS